MVSGSRPTDYAYCVSRIRAVERSLLDFNKIQQIADAKSVADALRLIYDAGYPNLDNYEESFAHAQQEAYSLLEKILPDPTVLHVFLIRNDYHNLKVILKMEFLDRNLDALLMERCLFGVAAIKEAVTARRGKQLSVIFERTIQAAAEEFAHTKSAQSVDMIIDKGMYENMRQLADATENNFIRELIKIQIDLANLLTLVRLRRLKKNEDFAKKALIEGGRLDLDFFTANLTVAKEVAATAVGATPYGKLIAETAAEALGGSSADVTRFEVLCGNYLADYIKKAKFVHFGPEPLVAYLLAKENEIKQLRIIMVGKQNAMDSKMIKERLNAAYV